MLLAVLALGFGLSASALERPGGYFLSGPEKPTATPVTRLVYAGPMPAVDATFAGKTETVSMARSRGSQNRLPWLWLDPAVQLQPARLPSIPNFELISEAKVATVNGRSIAADPLFNPLDSAPLDLRQKVGVGLMTIMPTPALPNAVEPETFCQGFC